MDSRHTGVQDRRGRLLLAAPILLASLLICTPQGYAATAAGQTASTAKSAESGDSSKFPKGLTALDPETVLKDSSACSTFHPASGNEICSISNGGCSSNSGFANRDGCGAIIRAWGGGIADLQRLRMIIHGGGHGDYGGNEVIAVPFASSPSTIKRIFGPTLPGVGTCANFRVATPIERIPPKVESGNCVEPDHGEPNSIHSYGSLAYMHDSAGADYMLRWGGSLASGSGGISKLAWLFDFAQNAWSEIRFVSKPAMPAVSEPSQVSLQEDPATPGKVWVVTDNELGFFTVDPSAKTAKYTRVRSGGGGWWSSYGYAQFDFEHKVVLYPTATGTTPQLMLLPLNGSGDPVDVAGKTTGCSDLLTDLKDREHSRFGVTWDSKDGRFYIWPNGISKHIYSFDAATRSCNSIPYEGGPTAIITGGTYGRFRYIPAKDYFVLWPDYDQPLYVFCAKEDGCSR